MRLSRNALRRLSAVGLTAAATLAAGVSLAAPASAAQGTILGADRADVVPGSYIVVLKNGVAAAASTDGLAAAYGGKVSHRFTSVNGFATTMSQAQAKKLAADPSVAYVEADQVVRMTVDQPNPPSWGLDRIDQRDLPLNSNYAYSTTASNVNAYIIDTGINLTHTDYAGRAVSGTDKVDNDSDATDCQGHGSHVAGTVGGTKYGVAKGVKLIGVRVLDCAGSGTTAGVIAGVDWVTANAVKPAVANMSLGGGASTTLDNAVAASIASGVTYGIASGNSNANACNYSPARVPTAITVNASDRNDARASFSNFGTCTDIFAPGVDITSAWIGSTTATNTISGTSMATPHIVGGAALYLAANPTATPAQVASALTSAATPNKITNPGTGSPNLLEYTGTGGTTPPGPGCAAVSNSTVTAIPDNSSVTSNITVAGCSGNAGSASTVAVNITHTYRGDLVIDLIAPDGTTYRLKNSSSSDSADNVVATYTVNLSAKPANGVWKLKVADVYAADTGKLNSWTLDL